MARRRLDLRGAAEALGTSVDAVRKRIARGTLESEKADGKVYVWLDDDAPRSDTERLISTLEEQLRAEREHLRAEREAHAEARRLLAAALERIPIEAPSEPRESRETVEQDPERAQPRSSSGDSQERRFASGGAQGNPPPRSGTESSHGSLRDRLPQWIYVLGVLFTPVITGAAIILSQSIAQSYTTITTSLLMPLLVFILPVAALISFWFWVGYNDPNIKVLRSLVPIGALIGLATGITYYVGIEPIYNYIPHKELIFQYRQTYGNGDTFGVTLLSFGTGIIVSVFPAIWGKGMRRRFLAEHPELQATGQSATKSESSATPSTGSSPSQENWSPQKQTTIGLVGTLGGALLTAVATVVVQLLQGK